MSGSTRQFRCNCLFCSLFVLFISVLCFIFAFAIFSIIFQQQEFKFTVTEASLTEFNLTKTDNITNKNNTLSYNLAINVTIRNPNNNIGVYFDRIEAIANYGQQISLSRVNSIASFYQGHKNTTTFRAVFEGHQLVTSEDRSGIINQYNLETSFGIYSIDVKIDVRTRERFGKIRIGHLKPPTIDCKLKVPLRSNGTYSTSNHEFKATRCENVYI